MVDASGGLVALTRRTCRLRGSWLVYSSADGMGKPLPNSLGGSARAANLGRLSLGRRKASATVMRQLAAALALALCVFGCDSVQWGEQVPLPIDDTVTATEMRGSGICGQLLYSISDVFADPHTGTPRARGGLASEVPWKWPRSFTAWRVRRGFATETEVVDADGNTVLRTGGRYWICPARFQDVWIISDVIPCPAGETVDVGGPRKCELGGGAL